MPTGPTKAYGTKPLFEPNEGSVKKQVGWAFWDMARGRPLLDLRVESGQLLLADSDGNARVRWSFVLRAGGRGGRYVHAREVSFEPSRSPGRPADQRGHREVVVEWSESERMEERKSTRLTAVSVLEAAQTGQEVLDV